MWRQFAKYFNKYPKRKKLAQKILEYGLKIKDKKIYCGEIELSHSKLSKAFNLDRRIVMSTIDTINDNEELKKVFSNLNPTCLLKDVAPKMKWGVIEIIPTNARIHGIIAEVSKIISDNKISIRQALMDDFELSEEPKLYIVTEKQIPGSLFSKIRNAKGVKAVVIH